MSKKKILVVDDEPDIVSTIKFSLESQSYEVCTVGDGKEALDAVYVFNPDLIILDVMLPSLAGYEIARILKCDQKFRHIPIIVLTACTQKKDRELAKNNEIDIYMTKPFELNLLTENIKKLLSNN